MKTRDLSQAVTLRPSEVEALFGVHRNTVGDWCRSGELPSVKIGGRKGRKGVRLIKRADVDAFLAKHEVGGSFFCPEA